LNSYTTAVLRKEDDHFVVMNPRSIPPGRYLAFALTPALPAFAYRPEILAQLADRATPVTVPGGPPFKISLTAIEAHPLAGEPY